MKASSLSRDSDQLALSNSGRVGIVFIFLSAQLSSPVPVLDLNVDLEESLIQIPANFLAFGCFLTVASQGFQAEMT